jgi:epoxide hydrolase-like predicted phosphatase
LWHWNSRRPSRHYTRIVPEPDYRLQQDHFQRQSAAVKLLLQLVEMIKAVIFDCFGVLTTESFDVFRSEYFSDNPDKRQQANQAMDKLNSAQIGYDQFLKTIADLSELTPEKVEEYLSRNTTNKPLFDFIRTQLKPKYKIGILSNAGANWLEKLFGESNVKLFNDVVLSYEYGMAKPDSEIYKLAAERLEVQPEECVFIDDNSKHCRGAEATGMHAIWYQNFEQTQEELKKILAAGSND